MISFARLRVVDRPTTGGHHPCQWGRATEAAAMEYFDHILNWKLKAGSHPFPGKDGGPCINEAALIAAGFDYKPIYRAQDMPACFSRPICRFAMQMNDMAGDEERQRLL